jgi:1-deoxy-D-xylulose 5-phosphate reductoisomerase
VQVALGREQLRVARKLPHRFQVCAASHERRQKVVTERVEAARRQRVSTLDLFERAQNRLPLRRAAVHVEDHAGRGKLPTHGLS